MLKAKGVQDDMTIAKLTKSNSSNEALKMQLDSMLKEAAERDAREAAEREAANKSPPVELHDHEECLDFGIFRHLCVHLSASSTTPTRLQQRKSLYRSSCTVSSLPFLVLFSLKMVLMRLPRRKAMSVLTRVSTWKGMGKSGKGVVTVAASVSSCQHFSAPSSAPSL